MILAIIGLFQYFFMKQVIYQNKAESIQSQILSIPPDTWQQLLNNSQNNNLTEEPDNKPTKGANHFPFFFLEGSTIAIIDSKGHFSAITDLPITAGEAPVLAEQDYQNAMNPKYKLIYKVLKQTTGSEQLIVLQPIQTRNHLPEIIQVSISTESLQDVMIRQLFTFLSLSLLALIGGMLAFIPVLRRTLVPLSNMVNKVEQIDSGNLAEYFPTKQGQIEIDRLAVSFNGMLKRLEASFAAEKDAKEQMRRFVADASHELRTPLTSIHGFLEVLLRGAMHQPDKLYKSLKSMYSESERMKKLIQDLLLLAKLDRSPNIQLTEGELDCIIEEMEPQLKLLAGNRQVTLQLKSNLKCWFDKDKMKQVILNLFQNAVQHTDPEKGLIELSLDSSADSIKLTVSDNGSGIQKEHLPHLFDRFYRSDISRTRKYGGAGLGLAITKSIVELHKGTIRVESSEGKGSTFYVQFPLASL
jgi:two-component system OmpR family sensor kinase